MIPSFVSLFKDNESLVHIYFYPGFDDYDRMISRIDLTSKQNLDYKYVKNSDRSIEYIIVNSPDSDYIEFQTINNMNKQITQCKFSLENICIE